MFHHYETVHFGFLVFGFLRSISAPYFYDSALLPSATRHLQEGPPALKNEMWNLENIFQLSYVFVDNIIQDNNCQAKLDLQHNIIRN